MAKEELLVLDGVIDELFPDGRCGVLLENDHRIIAYTAGKMRKYRIKSIVGDRVKVEPTSASFAGKIRPLARRRPHQRSGNERVPAQAQG